MLLSLKVWAFYFIFSLVSDVLPDFCGKLRGEGIVKASLKGTYCGFCKRLLPVSPVPGVSGNRHEVQPIITEGCPWTGWKFLNGCLPMHSSAEIGVGVCTGRVSPETGLVRCNVITLTAHANSNVDIVPGPLATNV